MSYLSVPGARIYYETRGKGPLLLMIPGANGDAVVFPPVAELLASEFTVVTYDRRGFTRSALDGAQDYARRLETDASDARQLIAHLSSDPAVVFGTSSGAVIALQLLIDHPDTVKAIVTFEPAAMRLLSDGQRWIDFFHEVYDLYRKSGTAPARALFLQRTFPPVDHPIMGRTPDLENAPRSIANATYWFERELTVYTAADLDLAKLARYANKIVPAMGRASVGFPTGDAARALSHKLNRDLLEFPDGHVGYVTASEEFAGCLVKRLREEAVSG
jgi:acetyltransferase/esterase